MENNKGLNALEEQVLSKDLCTLCGACASLCPYLKPWQGRIVKLHDCDLGEGRCFDYCPRGSVDQEALHHAVFGTDYPHEMGQWKTVLAARATDPKHSDRAQTAGVVSALTDFALKEGLIDAAVLTARDEDHLPQGKIVRDSEGVTGCAGSSYVAGATLEALNKGPWEGDPKIGVVGIPCQVLALGKMRTSGILQRTPIDRIGLVIGLFCTWAFSYRPFLDYVRKRVDNRPIRKLDITPPPERLLKVTTDSETVDVPLDEVRPFIRTGCGVCFDMTSEFADISVGTVEGMPGWNTVIVRTDRGEDIFNRATETGTIETKPLPNGYLDGLVKASLLKKKRALTALEKRRSEGLGDGYLTISDDIIKKIMKEENGEVSS